MRNSLNDLVCEAQPQLSSIRPEALYNATVMYLFRGLNQKAYAAKLKKLLGKQGPSFQVKLITEALNSQGYVMKVLKIWMFYAIKNKLDNRKLKEYAVRWKVSEADVKAYALLNTVTMTYMRRISRKYVALTLERMEDNLVQMMADIRVWLLKFTNKKHRFIFESQGIEAHDIRAELVYMGIRGVFVQYPIIECKLHALNVMKAVIHNQGINIIHKYTTQKVGRLNREVDGTFVAKVIQLDDAQMNIMEAPEVTSLDYDVSIFKDSLWGKKLKFVELLCGTYCENFTEWLQQNNYSVDTNEYLCDRLKAEKYSTLILQYLGVRLKLGKAFLKKLQEVFQPYTSRSNKVWLNLA